MSVQGPGSTPFRPLPPAAGAYARAAASAARATAASAAAEPQAPSDSSLWELLTAEERTFFSQQASMGALTYGRARGTAAAAAPAAPIGQRLDVRG
jgi:hypothetical protein